MRTIDDQLIRVLNRHSGIRLAILFGSNARDHAGSESDIDLALLAEEPLSGAAVRELVEAIGREFGCPVDVVDLYHAPQPILGQVFKGRRLLGDNRTYAELLTRHLIDSADFLPLRQRILAERQAEWTQ